MRRLALVLLLASCLVGCPASNDEPAAPPSTPSAAPRAFATLADAVAFMASCLDANDQQRLSAACRGGVAQPEFDDLLRRHQQTALPTLYAGQDFPPDATTHLLGGHDAELGHLNLEFEKTDAGWVLTSVYTCR